MMSSIIIRRAEDNDRELTKLRALYLQARQDTFTWSDTSSYRLSDFDRDTEGEYILVAVCEEEVAGFVSIWLADRFIHHLYVDKAHHHKGVGTSLMKVAMESFGVSLRLKCLEKNVRAIGFYKKLGFMVVGRGVSKEGDYLLMESGNSGEIGIGDFTMV